MSPRPIDISVVVPTFRRPSALTQTLVALLAVDFPASAFEVIVVDDGSDDETPSVVEGFQHAATNLSYVRQANRGAAAARNNGAARARGELLVFVDDDIRVEPDHLRLHREVQERFGDCLVNGHWEFTADVRAMLEATPFGRFRLEVENWVKDHVSMASVEDGIYEPESVTACDLGIPRALFLALGGFNERIPRAGSEDVEFSHRASEAGCRLIYHTGIRLEHDDQRMTLRQFCERQRQGAVTRVALAAVNPDRYGSHSIVVGNSPSRPGDPARARVKKGIKRVLATRPGLALSHAAVNALERLAPNSRTLRRAYWAMTGIYIFAGVRQGLSDASLGFAEDLMGGGVPYDDAR